MLLLIFDWVVSRKINNNIHLINFIIVRLIMTKDFVVIGKEDVKYG